MTVGDPDHGWPWSCRLRQSKGECKMQFLFNVLNWNWDRKGEGELLDLARSHFNQQKLHLHSLLRRFCIILGIGCFLGSCFRRRTTPHNSLPTKKNPKSTPDQLRTWRRVGGVLEKLCRSTERDPVKCGFRWAYYGWLGRYCSFQGRNSCLYTFLCKMSYTWKDHGHKCIMSAIYSPSKNSTWECHNCVLTSVFNSLPTSPKN